MQESVNGLASLAHQTSSHNSSWATVSVIGGSGTVATAAAAEATSDLWIHLTHASIVFGLLLCLSGLIRFYWDAKKYYYNQKIDSGSGG